MQFKARKIYRKFSSSLSINRDRLKQNPYSFYEKPKWFSVILIALIKVYSVTLIQCNRRRMGLKTLA